MAKELKRLNTNMPLELVERLDEYAEKMYMSRATAINVLIAQSLDNQKVVNDLGELMKFIQEEQAKQQAKLIEE